MDTNSFKQLQFLNAAFDSVNAIYKLWFWFKSFCKSCYLLNCSYWKGYNFFESRSHIRQSWLWTLRLDRRHSMRFYHYWLGWVFILLKDWDIFLITWRDIFKRVFRWHVWSVLSCILFDSWLLFRLILIRCFTICFLNSSVFIKKTRIKTISCSWRLWKLLYCVLT